MTGLTQATATLLVGILTCLASLTATYLSYQNAGQLKEIAKLQDGLQNRDELRVLVSEIQSTLASTRIDALRFARTPGVRDSHELEIYNLIIIDNYNNLTGLLQRIKHRVSDDSRNCTDVFEKVLSEQFLKLSGRNQKEVINASLKTIEAASADWISCNEHLLKVES
jgi:hypothetical protein